MKPYVSPYDLAHAAARDAANRHMREHGRTSWNQDDYNVAVAESARLLDGAKLGRYLTPKASHD